MNLLAYSMFLSLLIRSYAAPLLDVRANSISASTVLASVLPSSTSTIPSPSAFPNLNRRYITPEHLINISPSTASCNASANFASECRNASTSAPFINTGFDALGIESTGEKAALLSLMLFESGNFSFERNHFPPPGRPGQGTRNMMLFPFIYQYAVDVNSTSKAALSLVPDPTSPNISNDTMNSVLDLVLNDELSFASAMWFYKRSGEEKAGDGVGYGCAGNLNDTIVRGLRAETTEGWTTYITDCIGTTVTHERKSLWEATLSALKN